ncbi:uncharacterized protein ACLA_098560 [Aspergillus clavatus NRRL 1]|uniref:Uncharacterized protein n=1 Tax=Aspergillus clavatus (strain ATCC 1007 / CBS 513.65 / DSM 816 / NCTC 3887 / NRRL 1 / QM 1276 / 107) TaxID=344612 RepID=A1CMX7_ASPCL|nr:uncharacterized protein ACLA_098560 [Aspergillus clavatus NRRL 1]EAW08914.1 hypothetical protein ACLA_098560 [Aspergillus clavatus NRRL 1]
MSAMAVCPPSLPLSLFRTPAPTPNKIDPILTSSHQGDNRSSYPEEASDPITPTLHNPSFIDHTKESASSVADQIAAAMQPGLSDGRGYLVDEAAVIGCAAWDAGAGMAGVV